MALSLFLAKVVGIYLLVMGLSVLFNREHVKRLLGDFVGSEKALAYYGGAIALIVGLLLVLNHNIWVSGWQTIITIVAWLALIKGLLLLLFPKAGQALAKHYASQNWYVVWSVVILVVGAYLTYIGFFA